MEKKCERKDRPIGPSTIRASVLDSLPLDSEEEPVVVVHEKRQRQHPHRAAVASFLVSDDNRILPFGIL